MSVSLFAPKRYEIRKTEINPMDLPIIFKKDVEKLPLLSDSLFIIIIQVGWLSFHKVVFQKK